MTRNPQRLPAPKRWAADYATHKSVTSDPAAASETGITINPDADDFGYSPMEIKIDQSGDESYRITKHRANFNGTDDHIFKIGYNIRADGKARADDTQARAEWVIESEYNNGTDVLTETYWNMTGPGGTSKRPIMSTVRHSDDFIDIRFDVDQLNIKSGGSQVLKINGTGPLQVQNGTDLSFTDNGSIISMADATNNVGNVLYVDGASSHLRLAAPGAGDRIQLDDPIGIRNAFADGETSMVVKDSTRTADHTLQADAALVVGNGGGTQWEIPLRSI